MSEKNEYPGIDPDTIPPADVDPVELDRKSVV